MSRKKKKDAVEGQTAEIELKPSGETEVTEHVPPTDPEINTESINDRTEGTPEHVEEHHHRGHHVKHREEPQGEPVGTPVEDKQKVEEQKPKPEVKKVEEKPKQRIYRNGALDNQTGLHRIDKGEFKAWKTSSTHVYYRCQKCKYLICVPIGFDIKYENPRPPVNKG